MKPEQEIARRRTFAIISHPDAGKTTLTEKLLLYGGALQLAGTVKGRKSERATASDWMEIEQKRGISISSTVLQFEYNGCVVNLLDTPGHEDFSEDTYRVLMAVDAAVMVIDAAKGVEAQTRKLFEVCRMRGVPIFTFVNKCDRPGRDPLSLVDEVEEVLGLGVAPVNWPLGLGNDFRGLINRETGDALLYGKVSGGQVRATEQTAVLDDPAFRKSLGAGAIEQLEEQLALLDVAASPLDWEAVRAGRTTPLYWGSALNNFGVRRLLDAFLQHAPSPQPRAGGKGVVRPAEAPFTGFVFKIQANMNPRHRDRVAFVRICSGRFERDMTVTHTRSGKPMRLSFSHRLFGQERETSDEAWAGDVIGIAGHAELQIGDTLSVDPDIAFSEIPRFAPETFIYLHNEDTQNLKRFRAGVDQLLQEKLVQQFFIDDAIRATPLLGAVGPLQFDVVQTRMESEYRTPTRREEAPWSLVRWVDPGVAEADLKAATLVSGSALARDDEGHRVILFPAEWAIRFFSERNADIKLLETAPRQGFSR